MVRNGHCWTHYCNQKHSIMSVRTTCHVLAVFTLNSRLDVGCYTCRNQRVQRIKQKRIKTGKYIGREEAWFMVNGLRVPFLWQWGGKARGKVCLFWSPLRLCCGFLYESDHALMEQRVTAALPALWSLLLLEKVWRCGFWKAHLTGTLPHTNPIQSCQPWACVGARMAKNEQGQPEHMHGKKSMRTLFHKWSGC